MTREGAVYGRALAGKAFVVDAGAAAGPGRRTAAEQRRAQRGCRRGVADAHLADCEQIVIRLHGRKADADGRKKFARAHCRLHGKIAGRPIELDRHHPQVGDREPRQLVDRSASGRKILHHLCGHGLRKRRDAACDDAVIAGKHGDRRPLDARHGPALPMRHPRRELLQPAEASRRLCQMLLPLRGRAGCARIALGQVATEGADVV